MTKTPTKTDSGTAMFAATLDIARLRIDVHCAAPACKDGIRALLALYARAPDNCASAAIQFHIQATEAATELNCNGKHIWRGTDAGEIVAAFEWAFYNRAIAALYPQFLSLHAATIARHGQGITIAGVSGAGKSSLCTVGLLSGADYYSDEYSLLDEQGKITPFLRPLQWGGCSHPAFPLQSMRSSGLFGEGSYSFFGRSGESITSLLWHPKHVAHKAVDIRLMILPCYTSDMDGIRCEAVPRSQALL
ncbi:MAG: hypothetical protein Q9M30_06345, partial [Mariprofundaceae bacterium]|nr:hypothetical protein [Mariprofundaceae bacterium]